MPANIAPTKSNRKISSVALYTLGCKLNFSESSYISKSLKDDNYKIVNSINIKSRKASADSVQIVIS